MNYGINSSIWMKINKTRFFEKKKKRYVNGRRKLFLKMSHFILSKRKMRLVSSEKSNPSNFIIWNIIYIF